MGRTTFMAVVVAASLASVARAQESGSPAAEPKPTAQEQVLLRGRNRTLLHPADPLKVSGREQDGNEMRAGTAALQRGQTATAGVNGDETYQRAIAMVESRTVYTNPPARAPLADAQIAATSGSAKSSTPRKPGAAKDAPLPSSNLPWAVGGIVAAAIAFAGWLFVRRST